MMPSNCFILTILIVINMLYCFFRRDAQDRPSLRFSVDPGCITVYNNETGFTEKNIRAVCDVGKTTKGKHKFGYIGMSIFYI